MQKQQRVLCSWHKSSSSLQFRERNFETEHQNIGHKEDIFCSKNKNKVTIGEWLLVTTTLRWQR